MKKRKHKDDKIFNNSYYHGDKLKGDEYSIKTGLAVDGEYASRYLQDIYNLDEHINQKKTQETIIDLIESNAEIIEMLSDTQKKFNKDNINRLFKIILDHFNADLEVRHFMDVIHVFDMISNISGLRYANLFDMLEYEYKKLLILDLDKKYDILSDYNVFNKMF